MRPLMEPFRLATEVAQEDTRTIVFRVSEELAYESIGTWSAPVQFQFARNMDGTFDLNIRTVNQQTLEAYPR